MNMRWHGINVACKQCGDPMLIAGVSVSADGEIMLDLLCRKCDVATAWVSTFAKLLIGAIDGDLAQHCAECRKPKPNAPIRPPVRSAPPADEKREDDRFLRGLGIDPDEPKEGK